MPMSFQNSDNFIRNLVTFKSGAGGLCFDKPLIKSGFSDSPLPIAQDELLLDLAIDDDDFAPTVARICRFAADFFERKSMHVCLRGSYHVQLDQWWTSPLEMRRTPLRDFTALEYLPGDGDGSTWSVVPTDQYWIVEEQNSFHIQPLDSFTYPDLFQLNDSIRVRFDAGYDATDETGGAHPMPEGLRMVLTMLTGTFYQNRELPQQELETAGAAVLGAYATYW